MLNVSDKAAAVLHQSLEQNEADDAKVFRIAMTDGGLALAIGVEQDGDQKIEHDRPRACGLSLSRPAVRTRKTTTANRRS